jgi:hypothetical protein
MRDYKRLEDMRELAKQVCDPEDDILPELDRMILGYKVELSAMDNPQ